MTKRDFTLTLSVDKTPDEVFDAINNARGWWSGQIDGETDRIGAEFNYRYKGNHWSKQKITEFVRGKRIVWHVLDAELNFVGDKSEWKGTDIIFDISSKGNETEIRFTHVGLHSKRECYDDCSVAWTTLVNRNLRKLIDTGRQQPDAFA